jgi:hypothetical protein
MSGIAQIIQAMMGVSPQVTTMGGMPSGGGGMRQIGAQGQNVGAVNAPQRPQMGPPAPAMPEIGPHATPAQAPQPGQYGTQQMGPPSPQGQASPQGQGQPQQMGAPAAQGGQMPDPNALQRQYSEAARMVEQYQNPQTMKDAWEAREKLPEARTRLEQAASNIQAYNQQQAQTAAVNEARFRGQSALDMAKQLRIPEEQAYAMADAAAQDPEQWREIQKSLLERGAVVDERRFNQAEEFRNEEDVARALRRNIKDIDEESARLLAATGQPLDVLQQAWRDDKEHWRELGNEATRNKRRWRKIATDADAMAGMVRKAHDDVDISTAGLLGKLMTYVPGTSAVDLEKLSETIKARVAFSTMEDLKSASEQGATGLGQVQIREFEALQNSLGALWQEQSPEALRQGLMGVLLYTERQKAIAKDPEMFDAMPDDEYFQWVNDFNNQIMESVAGDPNEGFRIVE